MGSEAPQTVSRTRHFAEGTAQDIVFDMIFGHVAAQVVHCAAKFSFADHLARGRAGHAAIAAAEGLDAGSTLRLMRACPALGRLSQGEEGLFAATPLLDTLRKDMPGSLRNMALAQGGHGHWAPWGRLDEAVRTGRSQAEPALGTSVWSYYASPAGMPEAQAFTRAMADMSIRVAQEAGRLVDTRAATFAVDLGGASGTLLHALMERNRSLRGAVFDLPHVVAAAKQAAAAAHLQDRLAVIGGDFRCEVPAADLYLLKYILHDWDDEVCMTILRNCRRAIKPGGRVVVIEMILDDVQTTRFAAQLDLTMLVVLGAKERTLPEFKRLCREAGFEITRTMATATPLSIIEAVAV